MTFAKGVTCGYAPLGGVIASSKVAAPFFDQPGVCSSDMATPTRGTPRRASPD